MQAKQMQRTWPAMKRDEIKALLNVKHADNPFNDYIGNKPAVEQAMDIAYKAYTSYIDLGDRYACNRQVSSRLLLSGGRSTGKTSFASRLAELIGTPYLATDAGNLSRPEVLFEGLTRILRENNVPLIPDRISGNMRYYTPPPCIVFIDEVHQLKRSVQDMFLKMLEAADLQLHLPTAIVDCSRILYIFATTDPQQLCLALRSRATEIKLERHTLEEMATIVHMANPEWTMPQCLRAATLQPTPRQAKDFATNVNNTCERQGISVDEGIADMAQRLGLDEDGLTSLAVRTLKLLSDNERQGLSKDALCSSLEIDPAQFKTDVLPLLLKNVRHENYIRVANRHFITEYGMDLLRSRNLA